ncbi:hypothetical protein FQN54_002283 [Arachnomyces sp. PD_36]|nr:hypothetical protein FQN54_002283 [Arachnomyces sp. PD_36]
MSTATPPWRTGAPSQYPVNAAPAYIPVQARRTVTRPVESTAPSNASNHQDPSAKTAPMKKKVEWPPEVRLYVQRCFVPENQIQGIGRQDLEKKLKQVITDAAESSNLSNINWEALPLPQEMLRDERNSRLTAPWSGESHTLPIAQSPKDRSKKRKSADINPAGDQDAIPPWRRTNQRNNFEDRVTYPIQTDKRQRTDNNKYSSKFSSSLENRRKRFEDTPQMSNSSRDDSPVNVPKGPVVGRSQTLEKNYLRLTSAPNPDTVRPLPILEKTLDLLKKKWKAENNYTYICDQFKSLRQDLTVQHIKSEFTVNVYEIHARIALEKGDLGEYNQCQTQLRALYSQQLGGHPTEFKAYRILYFIHTRNQTAMNDALADLTPTDKMDHAVKHALGVRSALALGNYHRFFQLYLDTPNMGAYLMDMFVDRERLSALACICRAYKPDVKIRFITEELGFESDEQSARFVLDHAPEDLLQEKPDGVRLLTGKAGPVFAQAKAEAHRIVDIKGQI